MNHEPRVEVEVPRKGGNISVLRHEFWKSADPKLITTRLTQPRHLHSIPVIEYLSTPKHRFPTGPFMATTKPGRMRHMALQLYLLMPLPLVGDQKDICLPSTTTTTTINNESLSGLSVAVVYLLRKVSIS